MVDDLRGRPHAKLAQVECNAPIKSVTVSRAVHGDDEVGDDAFYGAVYEAQKTAGRARLEQRAQTRFRADMMQRLRLKAAEKRAAAARTARVNTAKKVGAGYDIIVSKAETRPPPTKADADPEPETAPPPPPPTEAWAGEPPSQLARVRQGLALQAVAAREIMLAHCERSEVFENAQPPLPPPLPPPPPPPKAPVARPSSAPLSRALAAPVAAKSVMRSAHLSAAHADRELARENRRAREEMAAQTAREVRVAEAVREEQAVAERAEVLRLEVQALEQEAQRAEVHAKQAMKYRANQQKAQKQLESERYVEIASYITSRRGWTYNGGHFPNRYVEALRKQLRQEVANRPRPLPPLCACGLDPLDNHTERCARNCEYYKNPKAYARALSGLLQHQVALD